MCYSGSWGSQTKSYAQENMQQVLDKDMVDLHIKPSDAMNRSKWRKMTEEIGTTAAVTVNWELNTTCMFLMLARLTHVNLGIRAVKRVCLVGCLLRKSCCIMTFHVISEQVWSWDNKMWCTCWPVGASFTSENYWGVKLLTYLAAVAVVLWLKDEGAAAFSHTWHWYLARRRIHWPR